MGVMLSTSITGRLAILSATERTNTCPCWVDDDDDDGCASFLHSPSSDIFHTEVDGGRALSADVVLFSFLPPAVVVVVVVVSPRHAFTTDPLLSRRWRFRDEIEAAADKDDDDCNLTCELVKRWRIVFSK